MTPLKSCLYEGAVTHSRQHPIINSFRYSMFQVLLDLDELDVVFHGCQLWSTSRPALAWFRRSDHFGDATKPLKQEVADLVELQTGRRPLGPIRLLTHLRYFGYVMNPVSFFYCYAADGETLQAIVAEVHNTPWGERHCYVLEVSLQRTESHHFDFDKQFHISPFMSMDQRYVWHLSEPRNQLTVQMANFENGEELFVADMTLERRPITTWNLARSLALFPWMTAKVVGAIYWQALKLYAKGCPFYPHPKHSANKDV